LETDGDIKWSTGLSKGLFGFGSILNFYTASPLVVGDVLYTISGDGIVSAFNTENTGLNVEPIWEFQMIKPINYSWGSPSVSAVASPVLADGLLFISGVNDQSNLSGGRMYCLGTYSPNAKGNVTSTVIHVPKGKWWESFKANKTDTKNNTITFSILDENGKVLKTFENYNNTFNNISDLNSNGIRLFASFNIKEPSEPHPVLNNWELSWIDEREPPVFGDPEDAGWINLDFKESAIEVWDVADDGVLSGLDISTAEFKIGYAPKGSTTPKLSGWIAAESDDDSGVERTTIAANFEELEFEVDDYINITFRIKDLAGNQGNSTVAEFKTDVERPTSWIKDKDSFGSKYNELVPIVAGAEDEGANGSGIQKVSLIYQYKEFEDDDWSVNWSYYDNRTPDIYSWLFGELDGVKIKSGYYKILSRAKDKAGNSEDIVPSNAISFRFDDQNPAMNTDFEDSYRKKQIPKIPLEISDDYKLESLEYLVDGDTTWYTVADGIDDKTYEIDWTLSENQWAAWPDGAIRYIYFRITDYCGNQYTTTASNTPLITKVSMADLFVDLSDFNEWHWDDEFTISPNIPTYLDVEKVQVFYSYSKDNKKWDEYRQLGEDKSSAPYSWTFTAANGSGYYKFYTKITTVQGDVYTSEEQIKNVTVLPTGLFAALILLTTILIFATIIIITRMKKKKQE
jgi:hypothetical protein